MKTALMALVLSIAAPAAPEDALRARICLNGDWEIVLNAAGDRMPAAGWEAWMTDTCRGFSFSPANKASEFFRTFSEKAYRGGGTGVIVQGLPVMQKSAPERFEWLSESGEGNRDTALGGILSRELANWCDLSQPAWNPR